MINESNSHKLTQAIETYRNALGKIKDGFEEIEKDVATRRIIEVLTARDTIQEILDDTNMTSGVPDIRKITAAHDELNQLDQTLKQKSRLITRTIKQNEWKNRLKTMENAWWWNFTCPMDRFDWLWNALTVLALALAATFSINIYSAITVGNASIATIFSLIAQAAGIAAIGSGALSSKGQKTIQSIISKLGVPSHLFGEITFAAALLIAVILFLSNNFLDDYYYQIGEQLYEKGELSNAKNAYLKGTQINPNDNRFNNALGKVYESLGSLDKATKYYQISVENGDFCSLNDLGRVTINNVNPVTQKTNPILAESILLLGLQRAQTQKTGEHMMYQFRTNIGWALLEQDKLERAESYLQIAVESDEKLAINGNDTKNLFGRGMAYCFLAQVYEEMGDTQKAIPLWQKCISNAKPQFVNEYKWLVSVNKDRIAYCVDTKDIVSGYQKKRTEFAEKICKELQNELAASINPTTPITKID